MGNKKITVLMVEPGKHPLVTTLGNDLDSLQKAVSIGADYQGLIEIIGIGNGDCILCNEEGKLINLMPNRRVGDDIICGVFYVTGQNDEGDLASLTDEQIEHYSEVFGNIEYFMQSDDGRIIVLRFI